jgi:sulfate transport system ATP-binding protein
MTVSIRSVSKRFGTFRALDDVSLEVPKGSLVALLGPSGSGKTTLLRIVAGLESPDSGAVHIDGVDATHAEPGERRIGLVFQHYALFRHMTVFENVAFGLRVLPRARRPREDEIRAKCTRLLRLVRLEDQAQRHPSQLSGGQRQRIALARALAVDPRVLLLDEPFGALDAGVRAELRGWLRRLHDEIGVTSLLVTHDQDEALSVADHVVVMNEGRVEEQGPPDAVYRAPARPFTYRFLGPVSSFEGPSGTGWARAHEIDLAPADGSTGVRARVRHVRALGAGVRVELVGEDGELGYTVDASVEAFAKTGLAVGDLAAVVPRSLRVFSV